MNKLTKKCVAAIASLAMAGTLCVAGAVTMASVAWAKPGPVQAPADNSPWDAKNTKTTGTLTINKFKYADAVDSEGHHKGDALSGATFTLKKVTKIGNDTLDYKTFDTWSKIAGIVGALNRGDEASAKLTFDNSNPNSTVSTNTTTFENLPVGLYKVVETPPAGYGAADMTEFYITMPLIETKVENGSKTTTYNWKPTISPKNKDISKTFTKKLDDGKDHNSVLAKDKTLYYTISASVNRTKSGTLSADDLNGFAVFDDFPTAAFASPTDASSAVESVKIGDGDSATELTKNTDYNVSIVDSSSSDANEKKSLGNDRKRILVKFTDAGLKKIADKLNGITNGQDPKVNVAIKLDLSDTYQGGTAPTDTTSTEQNGNNEVVNKSGFFPASPKGTPDANKPDPIVSGDDDGGTSKVKYGWFDVFKYDAADEGKQTKTGLKGAEFRLFNTEEKANACAEKLVDASKTADDVNECSAASSTFKGEEATTQDGGKLKAAVKVQAGTNIYLVEVKAPEGYIRLPEVKAVNVEEGKLKIVDFSNTKKNTFGTWFNLPATGATGVIIFALAGMGLIAASVFLYMRNRKEEEQAKA